MAKQRETVFIQITNSSNEKLALLEKDHTFFEKTCDEARKVLNYEIGELLPKNYRFLHWGNPMSKQQEVLSKLKKCATDKSRFNCKDYPDDMIVYFVSIQEQRLAGKIEQGTLLNVFNSAPEERQERSKVSQQPPRATGVYQKGISLLLSNLEAEKKP